MRIVHLVSYPLYSGPVPSVLALARAQRDAGHEVGVAVDAKRGNFNGYEEAALPHLGALALPAADALTLSHRSSPAELWADWRTLGRLARTADVLHCHFSHDHALLALHRRAAGVRVRTVHAARSLRPRLGQAWLNRAVDGWIVRCARHAAALAAALPPHQPISVLPGSIDAALWEAPPGARQEVRAQLKIPEAVPVIGHVALLARRGQEELLQAVARLGAEGPHVLLVGRGEREAALRAEVERLGLAGRVHLAGYVPAPALRGVYAAMDAAFLAQVGNDAAGRAGLEAMAAGLPLLAVKIDALAELIDTAGGYPIAARHPDAIAAALHAWLKDPVHGRHLGQAARQCIARERAIAREVDGTWALYARCRRGG